MIFELAQDFHDAVAAVRLCQGSGGQVPKEHPKRWMLELLEKANVARGWRGQVTERYRGRQ